MSLNIVVIGEANDGKTTIVSSLLEDEFAAIGSEPGTTKIAHEHKLWSQDGELILQVWDTPGFEETDDLYAWFTDNHRSGKDGLVKQFLAEHANDPRWKLDMELLKPIQEGAIVIYVAASNREPQPSDRQQLEIIRLLGAKRIGLINTKPGRDYSEDWNNLLEKEISIVLEYAPLTAGIQERLNLLSILSNSSVKYRATILEAQNALKKDWEKRIEELSRMIIDTVRQAVQMKSKPCSTQEDAKANLDRKLKKLEEEFQKETKALFHHTKLSFAHEFFDWDITHVENWKLYGLGFSRNQTIIAGAMAGAVAGLAVDAMFGGVTSGVPTLIGSLIGGTSTAFATFSPTSTVGSSKFESQLELNSKVSSVLLERLIIFSRCVLRVSHGLRVNETMKVELPDHRNASAIFEDWPKSLVQNWGKLTRIMRDKDFDLKDLESSHQSEFSPVLERIKSELSLG